MGKPPQFSIVIPTAFRVRRLEIERRALALANSPCFGGQELVFSHGTRGGDENFCRALEKAGVRVISTRLPSAELPLGLLRNRGAEAATGKYLLFWDVDLVPSDQLLESLATFFGENSLPFAIIPCLYASPRGTRQFAKGGTFDCGRALTAFYEHRRDLVLHLALNTSTVAIERSRFFELGGFDERYLDHGLEDLDFLLRLALKDESIPVPTDLLTDERHQSPAFSTGFRSVLNLLSLPVLFRPIVTLHQWHRRPRHDDYYGRRDDNWQIFEENTGKSLKGRPLGSFSSEWLEMARQDGTLDSILIVHRLLSRSSGAPSDPSALFDEVPQYFFQPDRARRRLFRHVLGLFKRGTST